MLSWALSSALLLSVTRAAQIEVAVGGTAGLVYTPSNISANVGDVINFTFGVKNHTVTESAFQNPCVSLPDGFKSGFQPVNASTVTPPTSQFTVQDSKPHWFYCGQTGHCGQGMVFSINANEAGPNNFAAFQALAIAINGTATNATTNSTELPPPTGSNPPPTTSTSGSATCPSADNQGRPLQGGTVPSGTFISCQYTGGPQCTYFTSGSFSSGSSDCPSSATTSGSGSAPPADSSSSVSAAAPSQTASNYNAQAVQCPGTDNNNQPLVSTAASDQLIQCVYNGGSVCQYFLAGSFSSGSSTCPSSISGGSPSDPGNSNNSTGSPTDSGNPPPSSGGDVNCPQTDQQGGSLIGSQNTGDQIECDYSSAGTCIYFAGGSFSSGSSACPNSIGGSPTTSVAGNLGSENTGSWVKGDGDYKVYDADSSVKMSGKTITVDVGANGNLTYNPPFVSANVGDVVAFIFHPKNHTVTESTFNSPCHKIPGGGFKTGFVPVKPDQTNKNFAVKVISTDPKWFYCGQVGHCQKGMVFAINPNNNGPNSFSAFQTKAKGDLANKEVGNLSSDGSNDNGVFGNLSQGARIGIVTGIVAAVLIIIGVILVVIARIRRNRARKQVSAGLMGYNDAAYRPLNEPAPRAADMSHRDYDGTPRPSFNNNVYGPDNGASGFSESSAALYSEHHEAAAPYFDKPGGSPAPPKNGAKYETAWDSRP